MVHSIFFIHRKSTEDFLGESFRKAAPRCFPLTLICALRDNPHGTSSTATILGRTQPEKVQVSALSPVAGPLTEGDGARASKRVGFYIPDEPHHRRAVTCSFAL